MRSRARRLRQVEVPTGPGVLPLVPALADALAGSGPALLPVPGGPQGEAVVRAAHVDEPLADDVALLLPTSGSTGEPKVVELTGASLLASARATHERLGGPGRWLLALPVSHVAGWQVLVRSVHATHAPAVVDLAEGFRPGSFAAAAATMTGGRRYTSLVPTQLVRLLDDPDGLDALRGLDAVLVGGAASPAALLARAADRGVRVVTTYGMTETSGGCVYDGRPLDGVRVALDGEGRVLVGGPVLAAGYRGAAHLTGESFEERDGERWFATTDAGSLVDGVLHVHGRLDDVIVTGGRKVAPVAVEAVLSTLPGIRESVVVGVPDAEWGHAVAALVVGDPGPVELVRKAVAARLGGPAAPRHVLVVDAVPVLGIGKPDRAAASDLAAGLLARDG